LTALPPGPFSKSSFFGQLPLAARLTFFSAVFFVFAPLSLLAISSFSARRPWHGWVGYVLFGGITAAGFAYSFVISRKWLWLIAPLQVLWFAMHEIFPVQSGPAASLSLEGVGSVALIVLGYVLFVRFIIGEASRTLRLETEMNLARQIHAQLIPPVNRILPHLELYGLSLPSSEMGGDLLDVVETDGRVSVAVADVSGHGVKAGVVMGMVKSAMRMKFPSNPALRAGVRVWLAW
jgi:hypothetical protein